MFVKNGRAHSPDDLIVEPVQAAAAASEPAARQAMLGLSHTIAHRPESAVQALVDCAMRLTGAGSAGVSLEDSEGGEPVFRWIATSGEFARHQHGTMPRHFSPCGLVVDRGRALVMREPARHYEYMTQMDTKVATALLAPFSRGGRPVGTLWVVAHRPDKRFTTGDARIVQDLTTFVTAILDAMQGRQPAVSGAPAK